MFEAEAAVDEGSADGGSLRGNGSDRGIVIAAGKRSR
jgi:hypothetical protein